MGWMKSGFGGGHWKPHFLSSRDGLPYPLPQLKIWESLFLSLFLLFFLRFYKLFPGMMAFRFFARWLAFSEEDFIFEFLSSKLLPIWNCLLAQVVGHGHRILCLFLQMNTPNSLSLQSALVFSFCAGSRRVVLEKLLGSLDVKVSHDCELARSDIWGRVLWRMKSILGTLSLNLMKKIAEGERVRLRWRIGDISV